MNSKVRVRFAPSPTGYLHVGGARTALYDYLFAKNQNGTFVLRVEDTDQERSTEESLRMQLVDLNWLGLNWDEGPNPETLEDQGAFGPYRQSRRLHIYKEYAEKLLHLGAAYYCFLTDEEIESQRETAKAAGRPPQVNSPYRDWSLEKALEKKAEEEAIGGIQPTVRFKVPLEKTEYTFQDIVRGQVQFPSDMVGDFVLLRSSGMPVYNFCCALDDALMEITHVFRAEEHLSNTLRQMMILEALELQVPEFAHLSIILGEDRQKLSKRHGATSCDDYRKRGYLPEALLNYLSLLGWSPAHGEEIMRMSQMVESFDLNRLNAAAAVFDEKKLTWMNATHLRSLKDEELWGHIQPFLKEARVNLPEEGLEWRSESLKVFKSSMEVLSEAVSLYQPLDDSRFQVTPEGLECLKWEESQKALLSWKKGLEAHPSEKLTEDDFMNLQNFVKEDAQVKGKFLFMPIRVAVIGHPSGAELKILVPLMKRLSLIGRVEKALSQI